MATLIGRECWHVGYALHRGKIVKHDVNTNIAIMNCGINGPHDMAIPATAACLTVESAILKVEDNILYWNQKLKELESLLEVDYAERAKRLV